MVRAWWFGVVLATCVWGHGGAAPAAVQDAPAAYASARDAYLEGWFQETAQRDLQAALTAYRACVAKGDDRELAAKATLRMAWIARALGDDDAAKAQFAQVVEQYGDTKAAEDARAELDAPAVDPAMSGAAAVVLEARKALEEMFANEEGVTPGKVEQVFAVLGAQDFADVRKASGKEGEAVLRTLFRLGRVDLLVAIAEAGVVGSVMRLAGTLGYVPEFDGKLDRFATPEAVDAIHVVQFALGQSATSTHAIAVALLRDRDRITAERWNRANNEGTFWPFVFRAGLAPQTEPTEVFDAIIDLVRSDDRDRDGPQLGGLTTPFARRVIARYAEFPARQRASFAGYYYNDPSVSFGALDRSLFDAMLGDVDPAVRRAPIQRMAQDVDATIASEGIRRAFAESPIDVSVVERELGNRAQPIPTEVFLEAPAGAAREWMYFALFNARDVQRVLELGLERNDSEVLTAFFDPSAFVRNPAVMWSGQLLDDVHSPSQRQEVRSALVATSDTQLLDRLAETAAKHERLRVRLAAAQLFAALARERDAAAQLMRFAADPSPAVRIHVASQAARLSSEARRDLALDSSWDVGVAALMQFDDPATIEFLAQVAAADRAEKVLELAQALDVRAAQFTILEREDVSEGLAQRAFGVLEARDPTAIVRALVVGQRAGRTSLAADARNALAQLAHLEPIKTHYDQLIQARGRDDEDRAIAELPKIAREIEIAWREVKSAALLRELAAQQGLDARAFGRRLAAVTTREQLRSMLEAQGHEPTTSVVAWALAEHGAKDLLVVQLTSPFASEDLGWLADPLIAVGAAEDAIHAAVEGRLSPDRVWQALVTAREFAAAGRMRYGPAASFVNVGSNTATETAIATALEEAGDVDTLLRAVAIGGSGPALRALLRLKKQELVFEQLPTLPTERAHAVTAQLLELTRVGPAYGNAWPSFADEQRALIEKFRAALANP